MLWGTALRNAAIFGGGNIVPAAAQAKVEAEHEVQSEREGESEHKVESEHEGESEHKVESERKVESEHKLI